MAQDLNEYAWVFPFFLTAFHVFSICLPLSNFISRAVVSRLRRLYECKWRFKEGCTSSWRLVSHSVFLNKPECVANKSWEKIHRFPFSTPCFYCKQVQRHLQLRIEAQGKYLQSILERACQALSDQAAASAGLEAAREELSELAIKVSNDSKEMAPLETQKVLPFSELAAALENRKAPTVMPRIGDCSMDSCLTSAGSPVSPIGVGSTATAMKRPRPVFSHGDSMALEGNARHDVEWMMSNIGWNLGLSLSKSSAFSSNLRPLAHPNVFTSLMKYYTICFLVCIFFIIRLFLLLVVSLIFIIEWSSFAFGNVKVSIWMRPLYNQWQKCCWPTFWDDAKIFHC